MSDNYILQSQNIHKSYRMGPSQVKVLRGVNIEVKAGEFVAIVGSSGSGKSTLLHILGALDRPDEGTVRFDGSALDTLSSSRLNKFRNKKVGFIFQFYHLLDELNVMENVYLPAMAAKSVIGWLGSRKAAKDRAKALLEQLGLGARITHKPYQLSGGERQRVAIARALMNAPPLLLADEPTGNLDWTTGNDILRVFVDLNKKGQTIIMVTHDQRIAQTADRIMVLTDGKIAGKDAQAKSIL